MAATKIPWADYTWNVITGCSPVSEGCANCYAKRMAPRLAGRFGYDADEPFKITFHADKLDALPKKPCRVFVNSMGDFFHPDVPEKWQVDVFEKAIDNPDHIFLILTKRPENTRCWNLPRNVWIGVSVESAAHMDRLDTLRKTKCAVRFVSFEPLLGCVGKINLDGIGWVIAGGETGSRARLAKQAWFASIRDQSQAAGVPFFFKGYGTFDGSSKKYPNYYRIDGREWREFPKGAK